MRPVPVFVEDEPEHRDVEEREAHERDRTVTEMLMSSKEDEKTEERHRRRVRPRVVAPERSGNEHFHEAVRNQIEPADNECFVRLRGERAQVRREKVIGVLDDRIAGEEKDDVAARCR